MTPVKQKKLIILLLASILFLLLCNSVCAEAKTKRTLPRKPRVMNSRSMDRETIRYYKYREVIARTINTEGRNQPYNGQLAIGQTLINRYLEGYGGDLDKIAKDWYSGCNTLKYRKQTPTKLAYKAAEELLAGKRVFKGTAVKYYYSSIAISRKAKQRFLYRFKPFQKIGDHVFCVAR